MQIDLTGKTAVVTGSTAGIGFAIASGLARAGAAVVLNGRARAGVDDALARLGEAVPGAVVRGVAADAGSARGCAATVEEVANLAVYVASPLSSATTGAALRVDGAVVDTIA